MTENITNKKIAFAILVSALGYFVDGYDLMIFSAVRVGSLKSLGLTGDALTTTGAYLINIQLIGMLLGGLGWGILGDKMGRLQVLFGSITLYSLATFANAYVVSVDQYALCRFFGGVGLAGEIGAGITLVSELMSKKNRGYGTMLVAFIGICGIASAGLVGDKLTWQNAFIVGGIMGVVLLVLRISVTESVMFLSMRKTSSERWGDIRMFFQSPQRFARYLCCILSGAAFYLVVLFGLFTPEIGKALGILEPISVGQTLFYSGILEALGCIIAGYVSQKIQSRKKVLYGGIIGFCIAGMALLNGAAPNVTMYYAVSALIGFCAGYWAVLLSMVAEQFGTNLRATVATSVPNFVRSFGILHTALFITLKTIVGVIPALEIILVSFTLIAICALWFLRETHGIDLNYLETDNG